MAEHRSDSLLDAHLKSAEQFDYFILAIISAIVAYLAQNGGAGRISSPSYDIYLVSVVLLLIAMHCGFMRIERSIACNQINAKLLHAVEKRGVLKRALSEPQTETILSGGTGDAMTRAEAGDEILRLGAELPKRQAKLAEVKESSDFYYQLRNRLFFLALVALFGARVAAPYIG